MKVNFIIITDETVASFRFHNVIPAQELSFLGHQSFITEYPLDGCDVYVFSKHLNYGDHWYMKALKSEGKKTVFHCCDNHFNLPHGDHYRRMINTADIVTASTQAMADIIQSETGVFAKVIPDVYEQGERSACFKPDGKLKVLWFGHPSNLDGLAESMPLEDIDLVLCTSTSEVPLPLVGQKVVLWTPKNLHMALDWCDVVIIPSIVSDDRKVVKSHNRLTDSVMSGKFVIATPLPSYEEFKDIYLGDIKEGLDWLKCKDTTDIENRIAKSQDYIRTKYSPDVIGKRWAEVLSGKA